jgi:predicted TIM-barrel fold metal-dependent hydrolase
MKGIFMEPLDRSLTSRRSFVAGAAAAGAAALFPNLASGAQNAGNNPRRIDVHHHFTPEPYVAYTRAHPEAGGGGGPAAGARGGQRGGQAAGQGQPNWVLSKDMEDMDKNGTATAILSITTPGFWFGGIEENRKVMRQCNEAAAKIRMDHSGRFGSFAAVPMLDPEGALKEIEYAMDTLKADGLGLFTNYGMNKWLGDEIFNPIWEEVNRRGLVVYIHPAEAACCRNLGGGFAQTLVEYGADTTRTIGSLVQNGTTSKYPNIKYIFSHGGGMMPYVIERFLGGTAEEIVPGIVTKGQGGTGVLHSGYSQRVPKGVLYELRRQYYDTAQASNPVAMGALRQVVPVTQIVYGTDYWYRTAEETARGLTTNKVFNAEELRMINRGNVERIIPRYKGA